MKSEIGDVRDYGHLRAFIHEIRPEIVFHLAAQPIVRESYRYPRETFDINIMGTVNLLEALREEGCARSVVNVTTDKVYLNREIRRGYLEEDPLDGYDPYSNSKSCSDLVTHSYRNSFFEAAGTAVSTARAGNVIGGGDRAKDRLVPDCVRACEKGEPVVVRNPDSVRPFQHVLEPLSGYMLLAAKMLAEPTAYCEGWNFGPRAESITPVWEVAERILKYYGEGRLCDASDPNAPHEANLLMLDITKAHLRLGWQPRTDIERCCQMTADWYRRYHTEDVYALCCEQIATFLSY